MSNDFDADLARLLQIRRAHASARPKPIENPAWAHTHNDLSFALEFIDKLWAEYSKANEARFASESDQPFCWVVPGALPHPGGFVDGSTTNEGLFTKPLYEHPACFGPEPAAKDGSLTVEQIALREFVMLVPTAILGESEAPEEDSPHLSYLWAVMRQHGWLFSDWGEDHGTHVEACFIELKEPA